jgi:predicted permease
VISTDIRWAYRSLVRSKGFFVTAVATLGLALGLCTTTFALLDGVRHPYTPIAEPDRALTINLVGAFAGLGATAWDRFEAVRGSTGFASDVAFEGSRAVRLTVGGFDDQMTVSTVTPNYMRLLGITPILGRWFDSTGGPDASVVLSETAWRSWFPKKKILDGATILVDQHVANVLGVVPDGVGTVFLPMAPDHSPVPPLRWGQISARLKPGVTRESAHREIALVARRLNEEYDPMQHRLSFWVVDMAPKVVGGSGVDTLLLEVGIVVLLIACANLGGMMVARGASRRRDIALRMALGATRVAIVRQLLVESSAIALAGCLLGIPAAMWGTAIVLHKIPRQLWFFGVIEPHLSWRVFVFAVAAAALVGIVVGVLPGVRASQVSLNEPLKEGSSSTTARRRQRYSLVAIAELTMAMTLLMGTGLLVRAAYQIGAYDFGFDPNHLVVTNVYYWNDSVPVNSARRSLDHLLGVAQRVPGVKAVAVLSGGVGLFPQQIIPDEPLPDRVIAKANVARATTNFQDVLGLQVVSGRGFEPGDVGAAVAIVDEAAARELYRGGDALGRTFKVGSWGSQAPWYRVVGVIHDAELGFRSDPDDTHTPVVYLPPGGTGDRSARIVARVAGDDAKVAGAIAREVQTALGLRMRPWGGPFIATAGQEGAAATHNFIAVLFAIFGAVALGLSVVGLYAVIAYATGLRRREFGVRAALGATRSQLFRLAAHDGVVMTLAGIGIGAFVAMTCARLLRRWLYGVNPVDVWSLLGAEFLLLLAAFLACLGPARRAMKADPAEILRAV